MKRDLLFPENDPVSPTAAISGLFTIGGLSNFPQSRVTDAYQFSNVVTWTTGQHTLKFGADIRYNKADNQSDFNSKGNFTFNNLQDYMNNTAFNLQQALQTASWNATQWQNFFFAQDDFRVTPDLTLNLGLRYEISTRSARDVRRDRPAEPGRSGAAPAAEGHEQLGAARRASTGPRARATACSATARRCSAAASGWATTSSSTTC